MKMKNGMFLLGVLVGSLSGTWMSAPSWAVPIGIIDSGTDMKHAGLSGKVWVRPSDIPADEYADDVNGWNFAENNNQVIDYSYLGKFSPDTTKYFEVQLKKLEGTATEEEIKWMDEKKKDQKFIKELSTFGNFVHGTHVAGIASRTANLAKVMAAKLLPTEPKVPGSMIRSLDTSLFDRLARPSSGPLDDFLMSAALGFVAGQQTQLLTKVGKYVATRKMAVANCSFGTGMMQAQMIAKMLGKVILQRDLTDDEGLKYGKVLIEQILEKGKTFTQSSSSTLFVIAAGNDASDNDKLPVFPANLREENTISVAATRGFERLATFSNYGVTKVDIAAPGVGIVSLVPGTGTMAMSGTSQASPYIANLAGKVMDENSALTLTQVKKILMETVDKKDFLQGKVASGGIANEKRAVRAAALSRTNTVEAAIGMARNEVKDLRVRRSILASTTDGDPVELPSLFSTMTE